MHCIEETIEKCKRKHINVLKSKKTTSHEDARDEISKKKFF